MRAAAVALLTTALLVTGGSAAHAGEQPALPCQSVRTEIPVPNLPGVSLEGVAAAPDGSIWAVGGAGGPDRGVLLHSTGGRFKNIATPPRTQPLRDVVAPAPDEAWAVGVRTVLRWNGRHWRRSPAPDAFLSAVSASAPNDVWAVGQGTGVGSVAVLNWDGRTWKKVPFLPTPPQTESVGRGALTSFAYLKDVLAIAKDDVWVVGRASDQRPLAAHWDGNAWHAGPVPRAFSGFEVIAAGPAGHLWAAGNSIVAEWDGHAWRVRSRPSHVVFDVVTRGTEVWAILDDALARWSGSAWIPLEKPRASLEGLTVDAHGAVWAIGTRNSKTLHPVVYRYQCNA